MRNSIKLWVTGEKGNIAVMFALMLPLVFGGAAFGMETTYWYATRLQLQNAADAAALAGAMDKRSGLDTATITASATKAATANGFIPSTSTIIVNTPPTSGPSGSKAVEVILQTTAQRFFTAIFSKSVVNVKARAVAKYQNAGSACVLAMNNSASGAANFQGSTTVGLTGCSVMANSLSSSAINVQGSATLTTECLIAVGGVSISGGVTQTCGTAITGASPVGDPFASVAVPTYTNTYNNDNARPLQPGYYPNGISLGPNQTVNFAPGNYILGKDMKINNNVTATGTGVTFYMKAGTAADFNGGANINFTAPATGPQAGILFFGERTNTTQQKFNGNATSHLTGALYFKKAQVTHTGNFSGLNGCTQVVADTVDWTGNSTFGVDCSAYGMSDIPAIYTVRLSE